MWLCRFFHSSHTSPQIILGLCNSLEASSEGLFRQSARQILDVVRCIRSQVEQTWVGAIRCERRICVSSDTLMFFIYIESQRLSCRTNTLPHTRSVLQFQASLQRTSAQFVHWLLRANQRVLQKFPVVKFLQLRQQTHLWMLMSFSCCLRKRTMLHLASTCGWHDMHLSSPTNAE